MSKKESILIQIAVFALVTLTWIYNITNLIETQKYAILANTFILALIIGVLYRAGYMEFNCDTLRDSLKKNKMLFLYMIYAISSTMMNVYNGLFGNVWQYLVMSTLVLIFFTAESHRLDIRMLYIPLVASFILFMTLCVLFAPSHNEQYNGILINPNSTAIFMLSVFIVGLYYYIKENDSKNIGVLLISAITSGYIFYIQSRAAEVCVIIIIVLFIFDALRCNERIRGLLKIGAITVLGVVMIIAISWIHANVSVFIYESVLDRQFVAYDLHIDGDLYKLDKLKPTEEGDRNNHKLKPTEEGDRNNHKLQDNRLFEKRDNFTTGRTKLWSIYGRELGFMGHSHLIKYDNQMRTAHNTYIHVAYINGIVAGVALLLFNILIGVRSAVLYFRKKDKIYLVTFAFVIVYGMYTLVESLDSPLTSPITLIYYMFVATLMKQA